MRVTTPETEAAWKSPIKFGGSRPVVRATVERTALHKRPYDTENAPGGDYDHKRSRKGFFSNALFGNDGVIREIRNIRRISWTRSVDQDVAEATLVILNTDVVPIGNADEAVDGDFELPGLFTFSRGDYQVDANRWGYTSETGWNRILAPDRLVRTYEGYGADPDVAPGDDPNLYISGTWFIDDVGYDVNGDLTIAMRDVGRLLLDTVVMPPLIPWDDYPMTWSTIGVEEVASRDCAGGSWGTPKVAETTSSNNKYIGKNIVDTPKYVQANGAVQGHQNGDPVRGDTSDYWISTGQEGPDSFVWWEETLQSATGVSGVRIHPVGGPFKVFISLQRDDGKWYGKRKVPYKVGAKSKLPSGVDIGADIPYVQALQVDKGDVYDVTLKRKYANVKKVRITFTRLRRRAAGTYRWRAGLRKLALYTGNYADLSFQPGTIKRPVGNYRDYTDIVKWICAWGGLFWPEANGDNYILFSTNGPRVHYTYATGDSVLPKGRVWGQWQKTGTAGIADLTADLFDKQPLMDVIAHIKDITAFSFWFDEAGGAVWRYPNLYELGNYITPDHKSNRGPANRTTDHVTIDERETLVSYNTRLSSRNLRERIFVGDVSGKYGTMIKGYQPYHTGLRRMSGWTDQNFRADRECRVAADMIAARQMFDWRRSTARIWGNPAIQVDDQVRIYERVSNESFFHYVVGISNTLDMEQGTWYYDLTTHWLGERPSDAWVVRVDQLDNATQAYLNHLGAVE